MGYLMGSSPKTSGKSCSCRHLCRHVATFSWLSKLDLDSQKSQDCGYNRESLQQQQPEQEQQERTSDVRMVCSCLFLGLQHWYTLILYVSWIQIEKLCQAISQGNPVGSTISQLDPNVGGVLPRPPYDLSLSLVCIQLICQTCLCQLFISTKLISIQLVSIKSYLKLKYVSETYLRGKAAFWQHAPHLVTLCWVWLLSSRVIPVVCAGRRCVLRGRRGAFNFLWDRGRSNMCRKFLEDMLHPDSVG